MTSEELEKIKNKLNEFFFVLPSNCGYETHKDINVLVYGSRKLLKEVEKLKQEVEYLSLLIRDVSEESDAAKKAIQLEKENTRLRVMNTLATVELQNLKRTMNIPMLQESIDEKTEKEFQKDILLDHLLSQFGVPVNVFKGV